jgi:hypothetical protein
MRMSTRSCGRGYPAFRPYLEQLRSKADHKVIADGPFVFKVEDIPEIGVRQRDMGIRRALADFLSN